MAENDKPTGPGLMPIQALLPPLKAPKTIRSRLLNLPDDDSDSAIVYQHSVLCQTCMPYRDPGVEVRTWERSNGFASLVVVAGQAFDPAIKRFVNLALPFGPKPRLVLYHLNAEALRTRSPVIELEDSLTAFVKRTLGLDPKGRNIRIVKEQLSRFAAADFRVGFEREGRGVTLKGTVISGFELWLPKDVQQRVLWPSTIQFSDVYFQSLMEHAVPLNETAISRLSHTAMGLDMYTWLAQRLHRVEEGKPVVVSWPSLQEQFGQGYAHIREFRRVFGRTLKQVQVVYPEAKFDVMPAGMRLRHSRPPIARRLLPMGLP